MSGLRVIVRAVNSFASFLNPLVQFKFGKSQPLKMNQAPNALEQALDAISMHADELKGQPVVYLLARFWFQLPDKVELKLLNRQYPKLTIECQSFHASKGKEADYVVIMGMQTGKHGFPSMKVTPPILDAFLPNTEAFEFAEERRLFYVALTRAKHRVYVLTDMTDASPFVVELLKDNYAIEQMSSTPLWCRKFLKTDVFAVLLAI